MKTRIIIAILLITLTPVTALAKSSWDTFIDAERAKELLRQSETIAIDVRSSKDYLAGHIPGAINLPGTLWRTNKVNPGEGDSQYIFRNSDSTPDIARYEGFLSDAGVKNENTIIIYGNHAGKADGSLPALLLRWLGHEKVAFLDGIAVNEWKNAGFTLSKAPRKLPKSNFQAKPIPNFIWNLSDVNNSIKSKSVVFYDTRSIEEFTGENQKKNLRAGHIPGAVQLDYRKLLDKNLRVLPPKKAAKLHQALGLTKDKTLVLYCQTATRVSLPALALLDLGYSDLAIYDASWHEYGNRNDTKVVTAPKILSKVEK